MRNKTDTTLYPYRSYLLSLLAALDGVLQPPKHHPESDALYHSLQVFDLAYSQSSDPELWAAALFHDIGKSEGQRLHADIGAEMVAGILSQRIIWLIEHHLDLLTNPRKTLHEWAGTDQLQDLILLRRWDLNGRSVFAQVTPLEDALDIVLQGLTSSGH